MESMTEDEIQFHYFKIHDYDGNNMLDGIELISALTDYHKGMYLYYKNCFSILCYTCILKTLEFNNEIIKTFCTMHLSIYVYYFLVVQRLSFINITITIIS